MGHVDSTIIAISVGALLQLSGLLIWGATLTARVKALERDFEPLRGLSTKMARMETKLETLGDQLRELNASIRWMRDPAPFGPATRDFPPKRKDGG